jgi:transcriptional regulator GlxA family with amidase domain
MSETGMSLIDVAIQPGFKDQAVFTRTFWAINNKTGKILQKTSQPSA